MEGERLYGWQQLGNALDIPKDDLKYLETAYKRDSGSPTKELLEIFGSKGKRVSDIVNALRSSKVDITIS